MASGERRAPNSTMLAALEKLNSQSNIASKGSEPSVALRSTAADTVAPPSGTSEVFDFVAEVDATSVDSTVTDEVAAPPQLSESEQLVAQQTKALHELAQSTNAFEDRLYAVALELTKTRMPALSVAQAMLLNPNNTNEDWATQLTALRLAAQTQDIESFSRNLAQHVRSVLTEKVPGQPAEGRPKVDALTIDRFVRIFLRTLTRPAPSETIAPVLAVGAPQPGASGPVEVAKVQTAQQPAKKSRFAWLSSWWNSTPQTSPAPAPDAESIVANTGITPEAPSFVNTDQLSTQPVGAEQAKPVETDQIEGAAGTKREPFTELASHIIPEKVVTNPEKTADKEQKLAALEAELIEYADILSQEFLGRVETGSPEALEITDVDQDRVIKLIFNPLIEYLAVLQEQPRNLDKNDGEPFALISHLLMMLVNARIPLITGFRLDDTQNKPGDEVYQASARTMRKIEEALEVKAWDDLEEKIKFMLTGPYKVTLYILATSQPREENPAILEFDA